MPRKIKIDQSINRRAGRSSSSRPKMLYHAWSTVWRTYARWNLKAYRNRNGGGQKKIQKTGEGPGGDETTTTDWNKRGTIMADQSLQRRSMTTQRRMM